MKRRAQRSAPATVPVTKRRAERSPAVRSTSRRRRKVATRAQVLGAVRDILANDEGDEPVYRKGRNRYGMAKITSFSFTPHEQSQLERRWQRVVNRYTEHLEEAAEARAAGVIDEATYRLAVSGALKRLGWARDHLASARRRAKRNQTKRGPARRKKKTR